MLKIVSIATILISILSSNEIYANAGVFTGTGYSIELTKSESIKMLKEEITIIPGRGRFLFDGGVAGMDRVEYICNFTLKNLTQKAVSIQVGFPLNSQFLSPPYGNAQKTIDLVANYNFIAQEDGKIFTVKYSPGDVKKKLHNLFIWHMDFKPNEEKKIQITYSMPISMTLTSTAKNWRNSVYQKKWYVRLEGCLLEWFGYVTETGKSWEGSIDTAEFRVLTIGFEKYLAIRPFMEGTTKEERKKALKQFPVINPLYFRDFVPSNWDDKEKGILSLSYNKYEANDNLAFKYYILIFPTTIDDTTRLISSLSNEGFNKEDYEDLRDIFLEYNGDDTGNTRIRKFLENQLWYKKNKQMKVPDKVIKFIEKNI